MEQNELLQTASSEIVDSPKVAANSEEQMSKPDKIINLSNLPLIETGSETASSFEDSEDDEYDLLEEIDEKLAISGNSSSNLS